MTAYRIQYWEDGGKYTTVISASDYESLREMLKKRYNRFTIEEV
jgi:PHD/YefM family antitoxin component YafN of YafNO toxin-antitoxin module